MREQDEGIFDDVEEVKTNMLHAFRLADGFPGGYSGRIDEISEIEEDIRTMFDLVEKIVPLPREKVETVFTSTTVDRPFGRISLFRAIRPRGGERPREGERHPDEPDDQLFLQEHGPIDEKATRKKRVAEIEEILHQFGELSSTNVEEAVLSKGELVTQLTKFVNWQFQMQSVRFQEVTYGTYPPQVEQGVGIRVEENALGHFTACPEICTGNKGWPLRGSPLLPGQPVHVDDPINVDLPGGAFITREEFEESSLGRVMEAIFAKTDWD